MKYEDWYKYEMETRRHSQEIEEARQLIRQRKLREQLQNEVRQERDKYEARTTFFLAVCGGALLIILAILILYIR